MGLFTFKSKKRAGAGSFGRTSLATEVRIKSTLGIRTLESMPIQAATAFKLASDPAARTSDFVKVIEADEVLSARIIRIANSVYFRRGAEAKDIEKAVAAIGLDELRCLISATMLRSLLQGKHIAREQLWANAVATAIACRMLSRQTNIDEGEAFLCGLLHDVGKLIMVRRGSKLYENVLGLVKAGKDFVTAEEEVFDLNHVEVGRWIGEKWHFPESAVRAIAFHHHRWPDSDSERSRGTSQAMLVKAAGTFAHAAGIGHPAGFQVLQNRAADEIPHAVTQLGLTTGSGSSVVESLKGQFDKEYSLYKADSL